MSMSMDGKIATPSRGPIKFSSARDSRRMSEIRAEHDVVVNGTGTFRAHPFPLHVEGADLIAARVGAGKKAQPVSAVVSAKLEIPAGTPWEKATDAERMAICGSGADGAVVARLKAAGVKVAQLAAPRPSAEDILSALRAAGLKNVLVEGGGEFNATFLEAGLVNDVFLTQVPVLIGGAEAPTWCEGKGFADGDFPRFTLVDCQNIAGELYLHYRR
ncbi:MAG: RibD family protein [Proteobacteria bacterium]|nr:MAG: RibD family protein [Pseudomonadota bacterium]